MAMFQNPIVLLAAFFRLFLPNKVIKIKAPEIIADSGAF
jgi:hypothetical protein